MKSVEDMRKLFNNNKDKLAKELIASIEEHIEKAVADCLHKVTIKFEDNIISSNDAVLVKNSNAHKRGKELNSVGNEVIAELICKGYDFEAASYFGEYGHYLIVWGWANEN